MDEPYREPESTEPTESAEIAESAELEVPAERTNSPESAEGESCPPEHVPLVTAQYRQDGGRAPLLTSATWGFWATTALGLLIAVACLVSQLAVILPIMIPQLILEPNMPAEEMTIRFEHNGFILSLATSIQLPVAVGACFLFAWLRKGLPVGDYLGLGRPRWRTVGIWLALMAVFMVISDIMRHLTGNNIIPEFSVNVVQTALIPPLLWFAFIIAAPVAEEFVFRGFLFTGFERSFVGLPGALVITSLAWALLHVQYGWFDIGVIFVMGIVLGLARHLSGSLWVPVAMHVLNNLVSTVQMEYYVRFMESV